MAGHSKWANIQHRKGAQDRRRGKVFTKLIRELTVAARAAGADPGANPRLRLAIDRARAQNMPRDTIERAVSRGTGTADGQAFEEVTYEGYGPGGAAIVVDCMTDNRNRTVAEVRSTFAHHGGNLGAAGSVGYLFDQVGVLGFAPGTPEDRLTLAAVEAGAEDVVAGADGVIEVLTDPRDLAAVREALAAAGLPAERHEVTRRAATTLELSREDGSRLLDLLEALDDLDDVQQVHVNAALPAELAA